MNLQQIDRMYRRRTSGMKRCLGIIGAGGGFPFFSIPQPNKTWWRSAYCTTSASLWRRRFSMIRYL